MKRGEHDNRGDAKKSELAALEETFNLIKIGKGKGDLRRLLRISPTALSNRLKRLENLGVINLVGKYEMQITGSSLKHPKVTRTLIDKKLNKRGHAWGVSIVFSQKNDLWNNKQLLKEFKKGRAKKLKYGSFKLDYKGFTIIINKEDFTVYAKKGNSHFSSDALKSKFMALKDLDNLAKYLKGRYDLKGIYGLRIFREHYGIIFDKFATWILEQGRKLTIRDEKGRAIIWVDDSKEDDIGLKERESSDPMKANTMDEWGKDMDEEGWTKTSEIKKRIGNNEESIVGVSKDVEGIAENTKKLSQELMNSTLVDKQIFSKVSVIEGALDKLANNQAKIVMEIKDLKER